MVDLSLQLQVLLGQLLPLLVRLALGGLCRVLIAQEAELGGHVFVAVALGGEERAVHVLDEVYFVGVLVGVAGRRALAVVTCLCAGGSGPVLLDLVVRHCLKIKLMR